MNIKKIFCLVLLSSFFQNGSCSFFSCFVPFLFVDRIDKGVFFAASLYGNLEVVKSMLAQGYCINQRNGDNETPLHLAVQGNSNDVVEYLITEGADVNLLDMFGLPPLFYAVKNGNAVSIKYLLDAGASTKGFISGTVIDKLTGMYPQRAEHLRSLQRTLSVKDWCMEDGLNERECASLYGIILVRTYYNGRCSARQATHDMGVLSFLRSKKIFELFKQEFLCFLKDAECSDLFEVIVKIDHELVCVGQGLLDLLATDPELRKKLYIDDRYFHGIKTEQCGALRIQRIADRFDRCSWNVPQLAYQ